MSFYHHPVKRENFLTRVTVSRYSINQSTKLGTASKTVESQLVIELDFHSNDCSPAKFEEFMSKFQNFLNESYE